MRATYSTLAQSAGVDPTLINAIQGHSEGSEVLYSNYLNPDMSAYAAAPSHQPAIAAPPRVRFGQVTISRHEKEVGAL